jgi:hypothetical protein
MAEKFSFLTSTRFWALIIGGLALVAEGNFTIEAWTKGILFVVTGFTTVRTVDKFNQK